MGHFYRTLCLNFVASKVPRRITLVTLPGMDRSCGQCWEKRSWDLSKPCVGTVPALLSALVPKGWIPSKALA